MDGLKLDDRAMSLNASHPAYRFVVLLFDSLLTFGTYFCFDMPSVLQETLTSLDCENQTEIGCNVTCTDCLGISDYNYNLFYAIFAWTNAVVVIGAGVLIDKLGNRVGAILFSFLCLSGTSIFAVGSMLKGTPAMFPVMLLGRLLFGSGNGAVSIVQFRIGAYWFKNKEIALAFGVMLTVSRLGSVLNFFFTETFKEQFGLTWTLWGGAIMCGLGFISAVIVSTLDSSGVKQLGDSASQKSASKKMSLLDFKHFSLSYWLLVLTIVFGYNGLIPFIADSSKFIFLKYGDKFDLNTKTAAYISSAVYFVSMVISPFLGALVDIFGRRGYLTMCCTILTIPVFGVLAFTYIHPLIPTIWLGFTYSFLAASTWSAIPLVVPLANMGIAIGITNSSQMIGIGFSNLIVGKLLGKNQGLSNTETLRRWKFVMIFLLANTVTSVLTSLALNISDKNRGRTVNKNRRERLQTQDINEATDDSSISSSDESEPLIGNRRSVIN